jgi:hypothetical protein
MAPESTLAARSTTLSSSDAPEDEREKWVALMALVERQAI